jgi:type IV pilus assembly protein PilZ
MGLPKSARPARPSGQSGERPRVRNRRALARLPVELAAVLIWDGLPRHAVITDLGVGGAFAESQERAAFATPIIVVLEHPTGPLRLPGVVRWFGDTGIGIQFGLLGTRETQIIEELVGSAEPFEE